MSQLFEFYEPLRISCTKSWPRYFQIGTKSRPAFCVSLNPVAQVSRLRGRIIADFS